MGVWGGRGRQSLRIAPSWRRHILGHVGLLVAGEIPHVPEGLAACLAFVGLLPIVDLPVPCQRGLVPEGLPALRALVGFSPVWI